ncbi:MAG: hypothetical protein CMH04_11535 [Marinovum sp.]|nr:hypothetical protein [Marinovum sp.]
MTIKDERDSWGGFEIPLLFTTNSYRILLVGDIDIEDVEDGKKAVKLKRLDNGNLSEYKIKFQRPTYDNTAYIYPIIQTFEEDTWINFVADAENAVDERITAGPWNKAGRANENEKDIINEKLEEHAGESIRIVVKSEPGIDMPTKGGSEVAYLTDQTLTLVIHEDERINISYVIVPALPEEGDPPDEL